VNVPKNGREDCVGASEELEDVSCTKDDDELGIIGVEVLEAAGEATFGGGGPTKGNDVDCTSTRLGEVEELEAAGLWAVFAGGVEPPKGNSVDCTSNILADRATAVVEVGIGEDTTRLTCLIALLLADGVASGIELFAATEWIDARIDEAAASWAGSIGGKEVKGFDISGTLPTAWTIPICFEVATGVVWFKALPIDANCNAALEVVAGGAATIVEGAWDEIAAIDIVGMDSSEVFKGLLPTAGTTPTTELLEFVACRLRLRFGRGPASVREAPIKRSGRIIIMLKL
jgi:hypothetical protein